ncbi:vitamin K-dependent gamma-carboxylase [Leptospira fainei serovar Hurstbridge str. BUT 6]|uniref:Vitamin K-dependent gamma-carboxylase n=1 Tax=Leptospira fainei serovar Hurstbridge str. BUT 6 TaxID=1193011 RepID=S3W292_9LEPT|nr:HTTM domain-containing protein [Leptospira fainei]EPG74417.1 vitamin K-dependent gamma-carboxylase [Leptospira fainei serovar Hurstbridge str. BUT 6]
MKSKSSLLNTIRTELAGDSPAWSVGLFRFFFGILLSFLALRYLAYGWVGKYFLQPEFHFKYYGFSWVPVLPSWLLYPLFWILILAGIGISLGILYRICLIVYLIGFLYFNLLDVSTYLNHYYLVALLLWIMIWIPADRCLSVSHFLETYRTGRWANPSIRNWSLWLLRFQIGCVYFFGGLAKIVPDWLFQAQPLRIWLIRNTDFPVLGKFFTYPIAGYVFSYAGLLFDLLVPFLLLKPNFRILAYCLVLIFHALTWKLFPIGMFPWIMSLSATLFFPPSWPLKLRNFLKRRGIFPYGELRNLFQVAWQKLPVRFRFDSAGFFLKILLFLEKPDLWGRNLYYKFPKYDPKTIHKIGTLFWSSYILFQILFPLRHFLYPGNNLWTEQGFRFAWHIMLIQKNGIASFRVANLRTGEVHFVLPESHLTEFQKTMMSTQPDLILQFAHYLGEAEKRKTGDDVAVYADITVSLNGKKSKTFIDPLRDLMKVKEGFSNKDWILADEK